MESLTLGIEPESREHHDPRCYECPLSECNPGNPKCALKRRGGNAGKSPHATPQAVKGCGNARRKIDLAKLTADMAWVARHCTFSASGKCCFIHADPDDMRAHGILKTPSKDGKRWRIQVTRSMAEEIKRAMSLYLQGSVREIVAPVVTRTEASVENVRFEPVIPNSGCPGDPVGKEKTVGSGEGTGSDHLVLMKGQPNVGKIDVRPTPDLIRAELRDLLKADTADLEWVQWVIRRELERRQG